MSRGINKVTLIATAGNDPEVRFMPSGATVANVSLATNEEWTDKQTGQKQSRAEWHKVVFMDRGNFRLGQIAGDYIKKGSKVYIEGSLRTREWEKDGIKRYTTEIVANEMQLLDSLPQGHQGQGQNQQYQQQPNQQNQRTQQRQPQNQNQHQNQQNGFNQPQGQPQPTSYGSFNQQPNGYQQAQGGQQGARQQRQPQQPQQGQQPNQQQGNPSQQQGPNFDDFDDDIPF